MRTYSPVDSIHTTQYILPGFVIAAMRHINIADKTGYKASSLQYFFQNNSKIALSRLERTILYKLLIIVSRLLIHNKWVVFHTI